MRSDQARWTLAERRRGPQIKVRTLEATLTYAETEEVEKNVSLKELVNARHLGFRAPALLLRCCYIPPVRLRHQRSPCAGESRGKGYRLRKGEVWAKEPLPEPPKPKENAEGRKRQRPAGSGDDGADSDPAVSPDDTEVSLTRSPPVEPLRQRWRLWKQEGMHAAYET